MYLYGLILYVMYVDFMLFMQNRQIYALESGYYILYILDNQ